MLTHLPYAPWCRHCIAGKRPNTPHRRLKLSDDMLPMMSADYGYLGETLCFIAATVRPFGVFGACVVDRKGPSAAMIKSLANFIIACGLTHFTYRADKEAALKALFEEGVRESGRDGKPLVAVPEHSHAGESQSNGLAERAVQMIEDQARTVKLALEDEFQWVIPIEHPSCTGSFIIPGTF